ncbi:MAG TPA: alpha/beta fold hydrolase [Galbitalea sp.]|jgi:pimeloyl-ACP methyl ester carboxylesterase|nr:alpha/beta fold hydrolase [Galbitalea sp.]
MPEFAESADGTSIAYDKTGSGPALVITGGAFNTRQSPGSLVGLLAPRFTVYTWDRRGRGDSGNTLPYAIDRELDDLAAVIAAAGGSAFAYGHSSGAILTFEAAMRGVAVTKLAAYEPPYVPGNLGAMAGVQPALDADDPALAALTFVKGTGAENTDGLTESPWWPAMVAIADTLPYDLALTGDGIVPVERLAGIHIPVLVMDGGASPAWAADAAVAIEAAVPHGNRRTLLDQTHNISPDLLAPVLVEFFN